MTSKLLHAIVGVGIAFGTGAGCGGSTASESDGAADGTPDPRFDPFCDTTWPTTKATQAPPACTDPNNECDPGTRHTCAKPLGGQRCEERHAPFCIEGQWLCHPDQVESTECACFTDNFPFCTENGWAQADAGAG
jgi:hypothetical protein